MTSNPLLKQMINIADVETGLRDIRSEAERVLDTIEQHKRKSSGDSEMNFVMAMSGLELRMTKLSKEFRESFL